jgi:hypothetical protein
MPGDYTFLLNVTKLSLWASITEIHHSSWQLVGSVHQWWSNIAISIVKSMRGLRTLIILVSWTIWCDRNSRVFEHKEKIVPQTIATINEQIRLWILEGAKHLARLL